MAIGSFFHFRGWKSFGWLTFALAGLTLSGVADDQIQLKSGSALSGQITGVSGGQVGIDTQTSNGGAAHLTYDLSIIQSVTMAPPAGAVISKDASPADVVAALEPLVAKYAGLPADWVVDAMGQLADAYDQLGQADKAAAISTQISQLYANTPYQSEAIAGNAKLDLEQGKVADAMAALQPLINTANQNLAPSPSDGRLYAHAFLVYGQALQAQKQYAQALEAYLTVKTMFYQNPVLVERANQLADALRKIDPTVRVD